MLEFHFEQHIHRYMGTWTTIKFNFSKLWNRRREDGGFSEYIVVLVPMAMIIIGMEITFRPFMLVVKCVRIVFVLWNLWECPVHQIDFNDSVVYVILNWSLFRMTNLP